MLAAVGVEGEDISCGEASEGVKVLTVSGTCSQNSAQASSPAAAASISFCAFSAVMSKHALKKTTDSDRVHRVVFLGFVETILSSTAHLKWTECCK